MPNHINQVIKEWFADAADIDVNSGSWNDVVRAGLEALGYSGQITRMLKEWAIDHAGVGTSINTALRKAAIDMGGTGSHIQPLLRTALQDDSLTWGNWAVKWEDEDRVWESIG